MKNNPGLVLVILLFLVIGCDSSTSETSRSNITYTPQRLTETSSPQTNLATTPTPLLQSSAKQASVITDNAYLRQTPAGGGRVVEALPRGSSVEVIRQKGAWFYVRSGASKGWMHGNTIRYENASDSPPTTTRAEYPAYKTPAKTDSKTGGDIANPSGATAKCRDGTLSYSRNRRGTCSHHGGVAVWY